MFGLKKKEWKAFFNLDTFGSIHIITYNSAIKIYCAREGNWQLGTNNNHTNCSFIIDQRRSAFRNFFFSNTLIRIFLTILRLYT